MTEKIELLEERVRDTVMDAKTAVRQTFDLRYHVNRRPWQMLGLSVLAGFMVGRLIIDRRRGWRQYPIASPSVWHDTQATEFEEDTYPTSAEKAYSTASSTPVTSKILDPFRDELAALKGAAVGAVVAVVRDLLRSVASSFRETTESKAETSGRLH
jgi:hypothetical protein